MSTRPKHVREFICTKVTATAKTYHLSTPNSSGWALATVNDATGELTIQSDWGTWSHRWNIAGLGARTDGVSLTLTEFLGDRTSCDYLARKLAPPSTEVFDPMASVAAMRARLIERRLEAARAAIEWYRDDDDRPDVLKDAPRWIEKARVVLHGREEEWPYDRETVRGVYERLGELDDISSADLFIERFFQIDGFAMVTEEPWDGYLRFSPGVSNDVLRHGILPALVEACGNPTTVAA